jgi:hypothetical protein
MQVGLTTTVKLKGPVTNNNNNVVNGGIENAFSQHTKPK